MDPVLAPGVIGGIVGGTVAPIAIVMSAVKGMGSDKVTIVDFDVTKAHDKHVEGGKWASKWAKSLGYEWNGGYELKVPSLAKFYFSVWTDNQGTFLVWGGAARRPKLQIDSRLGKDGVVSLITCNVRDAFRLEPPPEHIKQSFPSWTPGQLYELHRQSLDYIYENAGLKVVQPKLDFPQQIVADLRRQSEFITGHTLWQARALKVFLTHTKRMRKPIQKQRLDYDALSEFAGDRSGELRAR